MKRIQAPSSTGVSSAKSTDSAHRTKRHLIHAMGLALLWAGCSAAQAQVFGPASAGEGRTGTTATQLKWVANEPGHQLIAPYFSTQGDNNTLLSWVNTDVKNGKLLKVRNGDTLLDFMVLLAPGDAWTASLSRGEDGITRISTPDKSCTLPAGMAAGVAFSTDRLQANLTPQAKATHTREGLVEAINMADVPPTLGLFKAILPGNGCTESVLAPLLQAGAISSEAQALAAGLAPPSGGLTGSWQIIRLSNYASYSGRQHAVAALDAQGKRAVANWAYAPQSATRADGGAKAQTMDLLLHGQGLQWTDLPDLSTPMFGESAAQYLQVLDRAGQSDGVMNEFVATEAGAVPAATDWVLSQPLRRFTVALDPLTQQRLYAPGYESRILTTAVRNDIGMGYSLCSRTRFQARTREATPEDEYNMPPPRPTDLVCGSVAVISHQAENSQVLQSQFAAWSFRRVNGLALEAGWVSYTFTRPTDGEGGLTMLGFSATSLRNKDQNGNYGSVVPHIRLRD